MSALLEDIAKKSSSHVASLLRSYEDESQIIKTIQSPQSQRMKAIILGRFLARHVTLYIGELELWVKETETKLREGINGNSFRKVIQSGSEYLKACQDLIEFSNTSLKFLVPMTGETESQQLKKVVEHSSGLLGELERKILQWKKIAERQPPELTPAMLEGIERGAEQIKQGKFKTGEQIREEIRNRDSLR